MIVITFRPEGQRPATSRLALQDAVTVSCLMLRSSTLREAINIEVGDMALLVERGRRSHGWFTTTHDGKPYLTARLDASTLRELGRRIHDQWLRAIDATCEGPERSIFVRQVAYRWASG